jgi:integrase
MKSDNEDRDMIGNRVRIYPRGIKGIYCADFWQDGRHCRVSLKTGIRKVAVERALALANSLQEGTYQSRGPEVTMAAARDSFLAFVKMEGRALSTRNRYADELRKFLDFCEAQGVKRLSKVTPLLMDAYRAERKKTCSPPTIAMEAMTIKRLLRWCASRRLIPINPLADYRIPKVISKKRPSPTLEHVQAILSGSRPRLRRILATLAFAGPRIGEVRNLRIEDVDLTGGWIRVESREGAETKTHRSRKVPIHPVLRELLEEEQSTGPWFFRTAQSGNDREDGRPIAPSKINKHFQRVAAAIGLRVGLKNNGYTIHSLRHFFETFAVNSRIPQPVIDTWMGHQGVRSMGKVYYELADADSQRFMLDVPFSLGTEACPSGNQT